MSEKKNHLTHDLFNRTILKSGIITAACALLAASICVLVYTLSGLLPVSVRKIDLSRHKTTELSDEALNFIDGISDNIEIYLISETGKEDTLITSFIERVTEASDKIKLDTVDPAVQPSFVSKYSDTDLDDNSLIVVSKKRSKIIECYDLYTFTVYDESDNELGEYRYEDFYTMLQNYSSYFSAGYYTYTQQFDGENTLLSAIDYVTSDVLPTVYALTGHGEQSISEGLISSLSIDNIDCETLILTGNMEEITDKSRCIIINSPSSDISSSELSLLNNYLDGGGNIILLTSAEAVEFTNLMSLTERYGLVGTNGYVYEENAENYFGYSDIILPNCASASAYLNLGLYSAALVSAHPITISEEENEVNASYVTLFTTSDTARFKESNDNDTVQNDNDSVGQYTVGVVATTSKSSFIWISSSYFIESSVNSYVNGNNYIYFVSLCEKLCGKTKSLSIESKAMVEDSLVLNQAQAIFWTGILVVIIPVAVIIIGVFVTVKRRKGN